MSQNPFEIPQQMRGLTEKIDEGLLLGSALPWGLWLGADIGDDLARRTRSE